MADAHTVRNDNLLVFIDETGDESLRDPNFPLFGLAGCAMRADAYYLKVAPAWRELRSAHFTEDVHAAGIGTSNAAGVSALGDFFRTAHFSRIGVVLTRLSSLVGTDPFQAASLALLERLKQAARWWTFDSITFILEKSSRGDALAQQHLVTWRYRRKVSGQEVVIPVSRHFMAKATNEPGLQIADFVAHTLGASTRSRLAGRRSTRADYQAVFQVAPARLVSVAEIDSAELSANPKDDSSPQRPDAT